jgi:glycine/sarcosine N-methyltransferase
MAYHDLYNALCAVYDDLFPPKPEETDFFASFLFPGSRLLDSGCATGNLCLGLELRGFSCTGFDLNADMIAIAKTKGRGRNIDFLVLDMRNILKEFGPETFDCIAILGNTLVHMDADETKRWVCDTAAVLKPGGSLVVQILDYEYILARLPFVFPDITAGTTRFSRSSRKESGEFLFETALTMGGMPEIRSTTQLHPIVLDDLSRLLETCGYTVSETFASWNRQPFRRGETLSVIVRAVKKGGNR